MLLPSKKRFEQCRPHPLNVLEWVLWRSTPQLWSTALGSYTAQRPKEHSK